MRFKKQFQYCNLTIALKNVFLKLCEILMNFRDFLTPLLFSEIVQHIFLLLKSADRIEAIEFAEVADSEAEDAMLLVESWFNMHLAEDWEPDDRPDDSEDPFGGDPLGAPATLF